MKNKYQLAVRVEAKMLKLNSWIMNEFCVPLRIPRMIINKVKKHLNNRKSNFVGHRMVYQYLEVNECMFKNNSRSIVRSY